MSAKKAFAAVVVIAVLGTTHAAWSSFSGDLRNEQTFAIPCSLNGFNPSWHSGFESPAAAKEYGFVKSRDGTWQLDKGCASGKIAPEQAPPHGSRRVKKKEP
jgi:hypothetical protein